MLHYLKKIILIIEKILSNDVKIKYGIPKDIQIIVYNSDSVKQLEYVLEKKKIYYFRF